MNDQNNPRELHLRPVIRQAGDAGLLVTFAERVDLAANRSVHALARRLDQALLRGVIEVVPGSVSLLVSYDPLVQRSAEVESWIRQALLDSEEHGPDARLVEIPVVYGGADGPDLTFVAEHCRLSTEQVVRIHCSKTYTVLMMGFTPGFPYLGGLDPAIAAPRLRTPRERVPAGSVGIAGEQTGIYPIDSPGGWRIIGRTALRLFDPQREPPFLLAPGDQVRFAPVAEG